MVVPALGDANMKGLAKGEILQLERKGYYIVDVPYDPQQPGKPIVLFNIPDGRSKPAAAAAAPRGSGGGAAAANGKA